MCFWLITLSAVAESYTVDQTHMCFHTCCCCCCIGNPMHQDDPINSESDQFCSKLRVFVVFWPYHVVTLIQGTTQHLVHSDRHSIDTLQSSSGKNIETFASLTRIAIQLDANSQLNRTFQANEPVRLNTAVVNAPRPPTVSYPTLSA